MDSKKVTTMESVKEKVEKVTIENRYEDIVEYATPAYKPRKKE